MAPRPSIRLQAVLLLTLTAAACGSLEFPASDGRGQTSASPSAAPAARGGWVEALRFSGDLQGTMLAVVAGDPAARSECTGRNSRVAGAWASTLYGPVGPEVYAVLATVASYRGPGVYHPPEAAIQVLRTDQSVVWQTATDDPATFTVAADEQSGTVEATLTNLATNSSKLRVSGRWSCLT